MTCYCRPHFLHICVAGIEVAEVGDGGISAADFEALRVVFNCAAHVVEEGCCEEERDAVGREPFWGCELCEGAGVVEDSEGVVEDDGGKGFLYVVVGLGT